MVLSLQKSKENDLLTARYGENFRWSMNGQARVLIDSVKVIVSVILFGDVSVECISLCEKGVISYNRGITITPPCSVAWWKNSWICGLHDEIQNSEGFTWQLNWCIYGRILWDYFALYEIEVSV